MKTMVAVAVTAMVLLTTPSHSQETSGAQGASAPGGTPGSPGGSRGKGHRGSEQKTTAQKPKVDEKAYQSALDRMSDKKYDPWHDLR
jgi:hypothetical protein